MDRIRLKQMTLFPYLGVTTWEKRGVQKVTVDLELFLDLSAAGYSDRIRSAVDYSQVYELAEQVAREKKYHLVEALAQSIVLAVLERFPAVDRAAIRLRKHNLPFDAHLDCVEVEMERGR